jgi:DNA ligase D-like protein (predicted 3'-phosphoesterase)
MSLEEYRKKRKFKKTSEPRGKISSKEKNRFVVHSHFAKKAGHHHDFRLETKGVLKSWAVPKRVPELKLVRRLAVATEDHPLEYISFQGKIPEGQYGAGLVKIFDKGTYDLLNKDKDRISFRLKGKKLKGIYHLIKTKRSKQWLIFKS